MPYTILFKIFNKEIKMVNNNMFQLIYLMILFGLSIAHLDFLWRFSYWIKYVCKCNKRD